MFEHRKSSKIDWSLLSGWTATIRLMVFLILCGVGELTGRAETEDPPIDQSPASVSSDLPESAPQFIGNQTDDPNFWNRPTMTGDWFGSRSSLQQAGVTFAGRSTQFGFGVAGGIFRPTLPAFGMGDTFAYTGRGEYDAILDLEKLTGLPKGRFLIRFEHWYGQYGNISLNTGAFGPPVFPAAIPPAPNDPGTLFLTNFLWTQPLSERLVVFAGKSDVLGTTDQDIFAGGDGTEQFVNQNLIANPAFLLGLPYTSFSAGFANLQEWGAIRGFVRDPTDRTTDYFRVDNLFSQGVILGAEVRVKTQFLDMPGEQHIGGIWKHVPLTNLKFAEPPPGVYPEPTVPGFPTLDNSYTIYYGFDQYFIKYANSDKGWGMFGRASISDGNPTPVQYFLSAGLGGSSPIRKERGDTFGLGWYFVGASNQFGPLPRFLFGPRNGTGIELYYNIQLNPWLNLTPDVQFIHPESGAIAENSFIYGIRLNAKL